MIKKTVFIALLLVVPNYICSMQSHGSTSFNNSTDRFAMAQTVSNATGQQMSLGAASTAQQMHQVYAHNQQMLAQQIAAERLLSANQQQNNYGK